MPLASHSTEQFEAASRSNSGIRSEALGSVSGLARFGSQMVQKSVMPS